MNCEICGEDGEVYDIDLDEDQVNASWTCFAEDAHQYNMMYIRRTA